jgi:hypothetical protein
MVHRSRPALMIAAFVLAGVTASAAPPADPLWAAGVAAAARAKDWSPGAMRLLIEVADDRGRVLDTWDNRYRVAAAPDGSVRTEVLSASHNGRDETRKEREAQAKREADAGAAAGGPWSRFLDDPLDPAAQGAVTVRRLAEARTIGGIAAVAFAFVLAKEKGAVVEGTAWLHAVSGVPLEVVSAPRPLPRGAHELATTVRYADGLVAEVRVAGSGSLLFLRRRFSSVITLADWSPRPGS